MRVADVEQGGVDPLLGDGLAVHQGHPQRVAVDRERGVDVLDGDADVVESRQLHPAAA